MQRTEGEYEIFKLWKCGQENLIRWGQLITGAEQILQFIQLTLKEWNSVW
ncbi:hypothetical protein HMPREF0573_11765 [Mobiluncus curtisii ATCC 43063]|uniref:Uncharacterized protein n=1 Tax=Mobiluncus curtisii (strain ATCC 43063 / DSM 2711 / V125) TaxID=548479 RepID=D6ZHH6_MOBCV|nr:hypothetical protein HMPREF0573_11765 [Mobiluncus curtisii ATCC 43063]